MCVHVSTRIRVQYVCNYIHTYMCGHMYVICMYVVQVLHIRGTCTRVHTCTLSQFSNLDLRFLDEKIPQSTCSGPEAPHGAT